MRVSILRETRLVILVIDDNPELSEVLSEFLSLQGYAVQCASNGYEGLRSLTTSKMPPALILLDVVMPVLDGWGLLTQLQKNPKLADIPVVIMSGIPDISHKAKEFGADAVVRKPIEPGTLLGIVDHFVTRAPPNRR